LLCSEKGKNIRECVWDGWSVGEHAAAHAGFFNGGMMLCEKVTFGSFSFLRRIPKPEGITYDASLFSSINLSFST
jgi:hypothetical protein